MELFFGKKVKQLSHSYLQGYLEKIIGLLLLYTEICWCFSFSAATKRNINTNFNLLLEALSRLFFNARSRFCYYRRKIIITNHFDGCLLEIDALIFFEKHFCVCFEVLKVIKMLLFPVVATHPN